MATVFDYVTVACFLGMGGAFFMLTAREPRTLVHLLVAGLALAIANQAGNAGYTIVAAALIIVATVYAAITIGLNRRPG